MTGESTHPTQAGRQRERWDHLAGAAARNPGLHRAVMAGLRAVVRDAHGDGGPALLDLGGGAGGFAAEVGGVTADISTGQLAEARREGSRPVAADMADLPFRDGSFATVVLCHALEHAPDPAAVLGEVRRVLRPGGRLVIVVPNAAGLGQLWKLWRHGEVKPAGNPPVAPPEHMHHYTRRNLPDLLRSAGWPDPERLTGDAVVVPLLGRLRPWRLFARLGRLWPTRAESLVAVVHRPDRAPAGRLE